MGELTEASKQRMGLPAYRAKGVAETALDFLKDKLPDPIASQIDGSLEGNADGIADGIGDAADKFKGTFGN